MDIRDIITTPTQSATPPEGTTSSPNNDATRDGESSDNENEPSSYQEMIEKWGEDILNENGPFRNVDMKKLIQAMVREASASDFDDMIKSLPNYEDARKQGRSFFSNANESFWKTVKTWERKLRAGEFNAPIPASMEEEEELLPYKDDAFLELWGCRVKISIEQHKLKKLKLQRARIIKHHQQKKNQRNNRAFR